MPQDMYTCTVYMCFNLFSTRPHQNVVWYNNSWLGFFKKSELCTKRKRKHFCKKWALILSQLNVAMAHRNYFRQSNLLERIAKCSYCKRWYFRGINFSRLAAQKRIRGLLNSRWADAHLSFWHFCTAQLTSFNEWYIFTSIYVTGQHKNKQI